MYYSSAAGQPFSQALELKANAITIQGLSWGCQTCSGLKIGRFAKAFRGLRHVHATKYDHLIMLLDWLRLAVGISLALFHRPIADFILSQEYALAGLFRQRGIPVPSPPTTETFRNLYFLLGMALALVSLVRIWFWLNPGTPAL